MYLLCIQAAPLGSILEENCLNFYLVMDMVSLERIYYIHLEVLNTGK